ncbi:hypothetical protein Taro_020356 [Colocasia esculenta]|uniref:Uncharacterized protein n=1 Tax=Colocasia esculenta TaxID=4460 RepID=A0A843V239_COLES|nr:hypothetical protein [Colocasia esculenta]
MINDLESLVNSYEERFYEVSVATEVQTAELDESLEKSGSSKEPINKGRNESRNSLNEQPESLIAELKVKSEMQEQIAELKQKLLSLEIQFTEEAFKIINVASTEKEATLISKLEEHASKLKDKDILCEQLKQQKELNPAHYNVFKKRIISVHQTGDYSVHDLLPQSQLQFGCKY